MSIQTITGVPPIEFLSAGQPLSAWSISGNGQQTGTPTPDNPIIPDFCGERTANLFNKNATNVNNGYISGYYLYPDGTPIMPSSSLVWNTSEYIEITSGNIALSKLSTTSSGTPAICFYDSSKNFIIGYSYDNGEVRIHTVPNGAKYCRISIDERVINQLMLNTGSTALPYEPFGYKLPLTCGSQTTPVYLGQTQTVRKIKKVVFNGTENWKGSDSVASKYLETLSIIGNSAKIDGITSASTHYSGANNVRSGDPIPVNSCCFLIDPGDNRILYIKGSDPITLADFKSYLAQQYAAGTPVTVWYVLATPETAIVNEPLAKIGDYADTVSSTNTGAPSIPTSKGSNILTIGTTLQPSEVSITYMSPNTIAENLQRLQIARTNIATAITTKGGTLVENAGFEDFPDAISSIPIINENYIASRYIDFDAPSTGFLIGNLSNINAFAGRRRCNVSDDGTIVAYYGDPSYTEDGSNGQVMVYQPKFYYKVEPLALEEHRETVSGTSRGLGYHLTKAIYSISDQPLTGFKVHPAFKNEAGNEVDYILRGAYEGSLYDTSESVIVPYDNRMTLDGSAITIDFTVDKLNSVAGVKPISGLTYNLTRANAEKLANNRGAGWHIETIQIISAEQILYMVEYGPNSQINTAAGVTAMGDNASYNCSSLTGSTSSLGNGTGRAASTVNEVGGTLNTYTGASQTAVSYRGSENDWGNIWKFIIGCNIYGDGTMLGGIPYICSNFQFADDVHASPYESAGFTLCNANGWTKAFGYGNEEYDWLFMPSKVDAPSDGSGMIGDYFFKTENLNGHRIVRLDGSWADNDGAGLFYWALHSDSSTCTRSNSARLCYVPQN